MPSTKIEPATIRAMPLLHIRKKNQQAKICNEPFLSSCTVINDAIQRAVIAKPECVGTSKHQHLIGRWWCFPLQNQNIPLKIRISHTAY